MISARQKSGRIAPMTTNADAAEIAKFAELAADWWEPNGRSKPLHIINPVRLAYIQRRAELAGKQVVDVGCGGGILSEAMAQQGAEVTGIDLNTAGLEVARQHAADNQVTVDYQEISAEDLAAQHADQFDVVTCLEMLEHVPDPASVINACATLVKPGGHVFFSTINRNPKAYMLAVVGAEYLLNLLPKGTHDYAKFLTPAELSSYARAAGLSVDDISGLHYDPLTSHAKLGGNVDVNYLMHCVWH